LTTRSVMVDSGPVEVSSSLQDIAKTDSTVKATKERRIRENFFIL
jgi:hypothetical protein